METILALALGVGCTILAAWVWDRRSPEAYWRAYDKAQLRDLEYFQLHPGCSYEDAHRHRDKVMRRFHRY